MLQANKFIVSRKEDLLSESSEPLILVANGPSTASRRFSEVAADLTARLPEAEVEHVGGTAVPGCLTKGDIDVLVRVSRADFPRSVHVLDGVLARSTRNAPTDDYVEYDYEGRGFSASVQLAAAGGWHDRRFRGLKAVLKADPAALQRYNDVKRRYETRPAADYAEAKSRFIESLLAAAGVDDDASDPSLTPGIHD